MRKSKYLGMKSDSWICTEVGVDKVQAAYLQKKTVEGKRVRSKRPGHQTYTYTFERLTSDGAIKMVNLNARQALQVLRGETTVEEIANRKKQEFNLKPNQRVSYCFNN